MLQITVQVGIAPCKFRQYKRLFSFLFFPRWGKILKIATPLRRMPPCGKSACGRFFGMNGFVIHAIPPVSHKIQQPKYRLFYIHARKHPQEVNLAATVLPLIIPP